MSRDRTQVAPEGFAFPDELEPELTARWKRLEPKGSAERYAWFFRKSRQAGFRTEFVSTEKTA